MVVMLDGATGNLLYTRILQTSNLDTYGGYPLYINQMFYLSLENRIGVYYSDSIGRDIYTLVNPDDMYSNQFSSYLWSAWINYSTKR